MPGVRRSLSIYAASPVSLLTPLCQLCCLPEPILNSSSVVIWQATYTFREEAELTLCVETAQARMEQEDVVADRSLLLAVEP